MKLAICAGTATTGKSAVLRHVIPRLKARGWSVAFLKVDVQFADEDEVFAQDFGIPTRKVYSGDLCPDHCNVMVLGDALQWAGRSGADILLVETAGLCLRCSPYVDGGLGLVVLEATSGMNLPRKIGPTLHGIGIDPIVDAIATTADVQADLSLRGNPPMGTCTICVGKKTVGWQSHFGVVRTLENQNFYRGE
jgi:Ni2+-binding GTPase involved in maturation of urease and hydrogenase